MPRSYAGRQRPRSWSSIRSRTRPPKARAMPHTHTALTAWPRCSQPVGAGAKRVVKPGASARRASGGIGATVTRRNVAALASGDNAPLAFGMPDRFVTLVEVSPRDGLQNEKQLLPTAVKVALVDRLSAAGFRAIEVTSFVSPKAVPQMADAAAVMAGIVRRPGVRYSALTPNLRGFEGALAARADAICVFGAASETFSQRNINCSIDESLERFRPVVAAAKAAGIQVRGTVSCALGCPYEGDITPGAVARVARELLAMGCDELSIADTIGVGTPDLTRRVFEAVLALAGAPRVNGHFHDTYGRALVNIDACLDLGVRSFDASVAGIGGCPFAPGATGNVATESVLAHLASRGFETGVDLAAVREAGAWIRGQLAAPPAP